VAGVLQKLPAGHGEADVEEAGQYVPAVHAVLVAGVLQ